MQDGAEAGKMCEKLHTALHGNFWNPGSPGHGDAQPVPNGRRCPELTPPYPTPNASLHGSQYSPIPLQGGMELSPCQLCIPLLSPAEEDVPSCRLLDTDYSNHILLLSDREYQGRIISVLFLYSKSWRKQELGRQGVHGADPSVSGMGTTGEFSPGHSGDVWTVCSGTNTAPRCALYASRRRAWTVLARLQPPLCPLQVEMLKQNPTC